MEKSETRKSLSSRIDIADLEYDINVLNTELNYHRSKVVIFEKTVKAQQKELDALLGVLEEPNVKGEIYK